MPSFRDLYKKPLLSAKNLGKKTLTGVITTIYPETIKDPKGKTEDKLVLELDDDTTRIALNKGNAVALASAFGDDYTEWQGKKVKVLTQKTHFMGEQVDGLLVVPITKGK